MELYLLRHAIAVPRGTPGYPNDDRPLTEIGTAKMIKAAEGISLVLSDIQIILTSPLKRTKETAVIVAQALGIPDGIQERNELLPDAPLNDILQMVLEFREKEKMMLVCHGPNIDDFAAMLIGSPEARLAFKKGALCRIDFTPESSGTLVWHLPPKFLRLLAKAKAYDKTSPEHTASVPRQTHRRRGN